MSPKSLGRTKVILGDICANGKSWSLSFFWLLRQANQCHEDAIFRPKFFFVFCNNPGLKVA